MLPLHGSDPRSRIVVATFGSTTFRLLDIRSTYSVRCSLEVRISSYHLHRLPTAEFLEHMQRGTRLHVPRSPGEADRASESSQSQPASGPASKALVLTPCHDSWYQGDLFLVHHSEQRRRKQAYQKDASHELRYPSGIKAASRYANTRWTSITFPLK